MFTELKVKVGVIFSGNAGNGFNYRASGSGAVAAGGRCTEIGLTVNFHDSETKSIFSNCWYFYDRPLCSRRIVVRQKTRTICSRKTSTRGNCTSHGSAIAPRPTRQHPPLQQRQSRMGKKRRHFALNLSPRRQKSPRSSPELCLSRAIQPVCSPLFSHSAEF